MLYADWSRACHVKRCCALIGYHPSRSTLLLIRNLLPAAIVSQLIFFVCLQGQNLLRTHSAAPRESTF